MATAQHAPQSLGPRGDAGKGGDVPEREDAVGHGETAGELLRAHRPGAVRAAPDPLHRDAQSDASLPALPT